MVASRGDDTSLWSVPLGFFPSVSPLASDAGLSRGRRRLAASAAPTALGRRLTAGSGSLQQAEDYTTPIFNHFCGGTQRPHMGLSKGPAVAFQNLRAWLYSRHPATFRPLPYCVSQVLVALAALHAAALPPVRSRCDLSPKLPPIKNRALGCRHAHRDGVSLFGRAAFLRPGLCVQRRRAQPGSRLAVGHRRSRRAAVLTPASALAA